MILINDKNLESFFFYLTSLAQILKIKRCKQAKIKIRPIINRDFNKKGKIVNDLKENKKGNRKRQNKRMNGGF